MTLKLGDDFEPEVMGITDWSHLSPFKSKDPMKAWYTIPKEFSHFWDELTAKALIYVQTE